MYVYYIHYMYITNDICITKIEGILFVISFSRTLHFLTFVPEIQL